MSDLPAPATPPRPEATPPRPPASSPGRLQWLGVLLFLFIPVVLVLFVRHPEPVGLSLAAGVGLMLGHRFLARPYMARALAVKCLWCNRALPAESEVLELATGAGPLAARCCPGHRGPAARFFAWIDAWRLLLRAGIFLPLLLLLACLAAVALGRQPLLGVPFATVLFKLIVGVTVNVAALGSLLGAAVAADERVRVPFPVHNFFLLGVRNLLWIFRLVGIVWIVQSVFHLASR